MTTTMSLVNNGHVVVCMAQIGLTVARGKDFIIIVM